MIGLETIGFGLLWAGVQKLFNWGTDFDASVVNEFYLNKWLIAYVAVIAGLFTYCYNLFNSWFAFPDLFKYLAYGGFWLKNLGWIVSHWQSDTVLSKGGGSANISVGTSN